MFSGKTEQLIHRLRDAQMAGQRVEIFKPSIDTRFESEYIVSHNGQRLVSKSISASGSMLQLGQAADVIGIDEAQFFDEELPQVVLQMALGGQRVIVAGLDMDFLGKPFGTVPVLLTMADSITKLHAICKVCNEPAHYSFRTVAGGEQVLLGASELYEARCRKCFCDGKVSSL